MENGKHEISKRFISLIRYGITKTESAEAVWNDASAVANDDVWRLAEKHNLTPVAANALLAAGAAEPTDLSDKYRKTLYSAAMRHERICFEQKRIYALLEKAQVPFIPLKGAVLRDLYSAPWLRTSADIDIFVQDIDAAVIAIAGNGYVKKGEGSHDIQFATPSGIPLELHFALIETNKAVNTILERVWDFAAPKTPGSYQYVLSDEMLYFYHMAHMAKHFQFGGCGVSSFIDIWLLHTAVVHDTQKRRELLKEGGLLAFAEKAEKLAMVWFGDGCYNDLLEIMEEYVIDGGIFGSSGNRVKIEKAQAAGQRSFLISRIFMSYPRMRLKYPVLKKWPVLLPLFWIRRWIELLLQPKKIENARKEIALSQTADRENVNATKRLLEELELESVWMR